MRAAKFREMLHLVPFRPFYVRTTEGDTFQVDHPDFAMIDRENREVAIFDEENHFRLVDMNHIVSLEPKRNGAKKPGRR